MVIVCWSVKGGSGTTVVAASLALTYSRRGAAPVLLVDLAGDLPAVLALPEPEGPGAADWLAADADVAAQALERLCVPVVDGLELIPSGSCTHGDGSPPDRGQSSSIPADLQIPHWSLRPPRRCS